MVSDAVLLKRFGQYNNEIIGSSLVHLPVRNLEQHRLILFQTLPLRQYPGIGRSPKGLLSVTDSLNVPEYEDCLTG